VPAASVARSCCRVCEMNFRFLPSWGAAVLHPYMEQQPRLLPALLYDAST
jgi:hypothetical protein